MREVRTFNFINSIKGGCGKTTFSIFLAKYLQTAGQKCLILDMDFQGTAMEILFHGEGKGDNGKYRYLNNAVREEKEAEEYIAKNLITSTLSIDVVFADSDIRAKERLRVSSKTGYSPVVQYNVFKGGLQKFLKKFEKLDYKHFIFDMPPSADGYSRTALECVMENKSGIRIENDRVNLFFISGIDSGQVEQTIREVEALLCNKDDVHYDGLFIVLNDNVIRQKVSKDIFGAIVVNFLKAFDKFEEQELKKICFLQMGQMENYPTYCIDGKGLSNIDETVLQSKGENIDAYIPKLPFIKYADYTTDYKLVLGKEDIWLTERMLSEIK